MEIALLNERITFQRNVTITDRIGNHRNSWENDFSCFATVGGESGRSGKETAVAGTTVEDADCTFTVRWCGQTANVGTTSHRILFNNENLTVKETLPLSIEAGHTGQITVVYGSMEETKFEATMKIYSDF